MYMHIYICLCFCSGLLCVYVISTCMRYNCNVMNVHLERILYLFSNVQWGTSLYIIPLNILAQGGIHYIACVALMFFFVSPSLLVPISMSVLRFTMFRRSSNLDSYLGIHLHPLASAYSCLSNCASEHPIASVLSSSGFFSCTAVACCIFSLIMDRQLMFHLLLVICA